MPKRRRSSGKYGLKEGERVWGVFYGNRIYLFSSAATLEQFSQQTDRYAPGTREIEDALAESTRHLVSTIGPETDLKGSLRVRFEHVWRIDLARPGDEIDVLLHYRHRDDVSVVRRVSIVDLRPVDSSERPSYDFWLEVNLTQRSAMTRAIALAEQGGASLSYSLHRQRMQTNTSSADRQ